MKAGFDSLRQAATWFALLRADSVTEQDRTAWQAWLRERTEHATAWHHIEAVSQRFEPLRLGGAEAVLAGATAARKGALKRRHRAGHEGAGLAPHSAAPSRAGICRRLFQRNRREARPAVGRGSKNLDQRLQRLGCRLPRGRATRDVTGRRDPDRNCARPPP
ncbi:DUF4880 domain-containing protein [Pusillimonas sp. TS35]|nr:DUF4880 domain-containing protein [Pusillimonas sp. TS35]